MVTEGSSLVESEGTDWANNNTPGIKSNNKIRQKRPASVAAKVS
jgi:hypothetical protein